MGLSPIWVWSGRTTHVKPTMELQDTKVQIYGQKSIWKLIRYASLWIWIEFWNLIKLNLNIFQSQRSREADLSCPDGTFMAGYINNLWGSEDGMFIPTVFGRHLAIWMSDHQISVKLDWRMEVGLLEIVERNTRRSRLNQKLNALLLQLCRAVFELVGKWLTTWRKILLRLEET